MKIVAYGLIGLGFLLLVLSSAWISMFPGTSSWTMDKDERWSQVKNRLHVLRIAVGNGETSPGMRTAPNLATARKELEALKQENERLAAEFQGIQSQPHTVSRILKWTGISLAAIGIVGWYMFKDST
jgi:hypothetical protein